MAYLTPHLGCDNANILVSHLDRSRNEFGIHNMLPEKDKSIPGSRNMVCSLLLMD